MNTESENSNKFYKVCQIKSNKNNLYDVEIYLYKDDDDYDDDNYENGELIIYTTKFEDKIKTEFVENLTFDQLKNINFFRECNSLIEITNNLYDLIKNVKKNFI